MFQKAPMSVLQAEPDADPASGVQLRYDDDDHIEGTLPLGLALPSGKIRLCCDGRDWATVPIAAGSEGSGRVRFCADLPPIATPTRSYVTAVESSTGRFLGKLETGERHPKVNPYGMSAYDVLASHGKPFLSVPWMIFDGGVIKIGGAHLPPAGDPSSLQVHFPPGVSYTFEHSLPSKEFGSHFWYWPNAYLSSFAVTSDLPGSSSGSDPFSFEMTYPRASPLRDADDTGQERGSLAGRVWIPRHLSSFVGFPRDGSQLTRVQKWSVDGSVTFTGYNAFRMVECLLSRYGIVPGKGVRVLDWGCGHGRVARHFIECWRDAEILGMDIDAENIAWCRDNLPGGIFEIAPLWPPSPLADASLDVVFGISVMTHLTAEAQEAWLAELHRALKPRGLALITFAGPGAVAWSSIWRTPTWWKTWLETGFDDEQLDPVLDGKIADSTYYRATVQSAGQTLHRWSRCFEIVDMIPDLMGNLDLAVMRRR